MKTLKTQFTLLLMTVSMAVSAQTTIVAVEKTDGTTDNYNLADVDSVVYEPVVTPVFKNAATGSILNLITTTTRPTAGAAASNYASLFNTNDTGAKLRITSNVPYELWVEGLGGMELYKTSADNATYGSNYTFVGADQKFVIYIIQ